MKTTITLWWKSNADVAQEQPVCEYTPEQINEIEQDQDDADEDEELRMYA